jgi:hypothetical protein
MCAWLYLFAHTCSHACAHTYTHIYTHTYTHIPRAKKVLLGDLQRKTYINTHTYLHTHEHTHTHTFSGQRKSSRVTCSHRANTHVCIYLHTHEHTHTYTHMNTHIPIHTFSGQRKSSWATYSQQRVVLKRHIWGGQVLQKARVYWMHREIESNSSAEITWF